MICFRVFGDKAEQKATLTIKPNKKKVTAQSLVLFFYTIFITIKLLKLSRD